MATALGSLPHFAPASRKEIHFFDEHFERGVIWYRSHFPLGGTTRLIGRPFEATPDLLFHPPAPARVASVLSSSTRYVAILRDPAERAISHYWKEVRDGNEVRPLEEALWDTVEAVERDERRLIAGEVTSSYIHKRWSFLARGLYARQLARWCAAVPPESVHVCFFEEIFKGHRLEIDRLAHFLSVDGHRLASALSAFHLNHAERQFDLGRGRSELQHYFVEPNAELADLVGRKVPW